MKKIIITACIGLFAVQAMAQFVSSNAVSNLDVNNINCKILNQGDAYWEPANVALGFEVPKGSNKHAIFNQGLWLAGVDGGGNLHTACMTYRQTGVDFWPGPIDNNGNAAPLSMFDAVYCVSQSDIIYHMQNFNTPGYTVPAEIANWPGSGQQGFAQVLAPFGDYNNNLIYDPQHGDYPYILGDKACYTMSNDVYAAHTETGGNALGVELHTMTYAFSNPADTLLDNTIFTRYQLVNKSANTYTDFYFGLYVDFDLGNYLDDYVGTDVLQNTFYAYNGDAFDDGANGYGANPPAIGVKFLNHNLANAVTYSNVNNTPFGNPATAIDYYNYLRGFWLDGQSITYGDDGRNPANPVAHFMYPGITDPAFPGINWTEGSAGNAPEDRRMMGSIGPMAFDQGYVISVDVATLFVNGGQPAMRTAAAYVDSIFQNNIALQVPVVLAEPQLNLFPNPAVNSFKITGNAERINIINAQGVIVQTVDNYQQQFINIQHLPSGVYAVQCINGAKINTIRLCKR